jgi:hypothetical protein
MLSGDLPYDMKNKEVFGIAFVRDPINRFISSYNMHRGETYRGGIAKDNDFDEFCTKALVNTDNPMWRNGQTFILGGSGSDAGLAIVSERISKGQLLLLPTERFDESCVLLERLFPSDFKDCSYSRYNVSKQNTPISEHQRATVAQYMESDFELIALAHEYLDSSMKRLFADMNDRQQYIDGFRKRCELEKQRKRIAYYSRAIKGAFMTVFQKVIHLK